MPDACNRTYTRHVPEETSLYRIIQLHLETFLAHVKEQMGRQLPRYVVTEFRRYLECGILAHGFARAKCGSCGHEMFVAFSCKLRGLCPSCNTRRMCETAANLADHILPDARLRQWVLSVPFELRLLLAAKPDALSAFGRIFVQEVARWQREHARLLGHKGVLTGGICFPQRFGASLNLNVHYHVLIPDAVFVVADSNAPAVLIPLATPKSTDLQDIILNTAMRCIAWLKRHGYVGCEDSQEQQENASPLLECLQGSLGVGELQSDASAKRRAKDPVPPKSTRGLVATCHRFNLHAGISVEAGWTQARERLVRYCARPPLSLQRLSILDDGSIAYRVKAQGGRGEARRVMSPLQFMARLSALVPPPRHPLIRFHGVFAPHHRSRRQVVALCPQPVLSETTEQKARTPTALTAPPISPDPEPDETNVASPLAPELDPPSQPDEAPSAIVMSAITAPGVAPPTPGNPGDQAPTPLAGLGRIGWAVLLKRVHGIDALKCAKCGDRMRFVEVVEDKSDARAMLEEHALVFVAPLLARARAPDWFDG